MTMNESWGWNPADTDYKSPRSLVHTLCEVVGRGGNLLLNVSPMGDGSLPPEQVERLEHVGAVDGAQRRGGARRRGRARAVAVLRAVDAARQPHLRPPAGAAVRDGDGAGRARCAASSGSPSW